MNNMDSTMTLVKQIQECVKEKEQLKEKIKSMQNDIGALAKAYEIIKRVPVTIRNLKYWINPKEWPGLDMFTDEMEMADQLDRDAIEYCRKHFKNV